MLLQDFLHRSAKLYPDLMAINDVGREVTYAQLSQQVDICCAQLVSTGITSGQHVAVFGLNSIDYVCVYFACAKLGLVMVPMNAFLRPQEIGFIIHDCDPKVIIVSKELTPLLSEENAAILEGRCRFVMGDVEPGVAEGWPRLMDANDLSEERLLGTEKRSSVAIDPDALVVQMYTSGTTGTPKGVMLSHQNIVSVVLSWLHEMPRNTPHSNMMQATPLFHVGGMLICLSAIASGSSLYMLPRFDAPLALDVLQSKAVTHTLLVPSMIQQLLLLPGIDDLEFPHLETMVYGASCMPTSVLTKAMEVFDCGFLQGYGLTETAGVALSLRSEDHQVTGSDAKRLQSAGRELLCCEVKVVNGEGESVAVGEVGEIVVRGDNVTKGYWNNPQATAETIVDGFLKTGDLGKVDEQGYVYVVERLKDMIIVSGSNVYPVEVENVLAGHPVVAEVAVIGLPNILLGEEVVAVVVLKTDDTAANASPSNRAITQQLKSWCQEQLAPYKCPVRFKYLDALPRTPAGKIQKNLLRERFNTEAKQ